MEKGRWNFGLRKDRKGLRLEVKTGDPTGPEPPDRVGESSGSSPGPRRSGTSKVEESRRGVGGRDSGQSPASHKGGEEANY